MPRKQTAPPRSMNVWMHMLDYFRVPFPSRRGFSAYRFPGLAAHIPFFIVFSLSGLLLCGAGPLMVVWMVAGLYLGRDVAVICHYALVLLPVIWIAMFVLISEGKHVELFGRRHPAAGVALTVLVLLVQVGAAGIAVIARDRRDRP